VGPTSKVVFNLQPLQTPAAYHPSLASSEPEASKVHWVNIRGAGRSMCSPAAASQAGRSSPAATMPARGSRSLPPRWQAIAAPPLARGPVRRALRGDLAGLLALPFSCLVSRDEASTGGLSRNQSSKGSGPRVQGGRRVSGVGAPWGASPGVSRETDAVRGPEFHGRPVQGRAWRPARSRQPALAEG
jgi:hypothetical protein